MSSGYTESAREGERRGSRETTRTSMIYLDLARGNESGTLLARTERANMRASDRNNAGQHNGPAHLYTYMYTHEIDHDEHIDSCRHRHLYIYIYIYIYISREREER